MSPVNWRQSYPLLQCIVNLFPWFDVQNTVKQMLVHMILAVSHKATGLHSLKRQEWEEGGRLACEEEGKMFARSFARSDVGVFEKRKDTPTTR